MTAPVAGILGVGVDLVDLEDFAAGLDAPGTRFAGAFSAAERRQSRERAAERGAPADLARHLGARWAAKEALVKAWSAALTGRAPVIAPEALDWAEIETVCDAWGRPSLRVTGAAARALEASVGAWRAHVSLTHEGATAAAYVVLESA